LVKAEVGGADYGPGNDTGCRCHCDEKVEDIQNEFNSYSEVYLA
jgi:hypothetical protein